eukprot:TRINITY_DN88001_c1_g1_i1.p1 TRINITY_DN88001_c1_g1~~TRINITY_DN88001_c1_g1_i1.p1  ORF type:complete len:307 (-),score=43.83 TRINITY_DN88001_c1_g1_i1:141-1061(-)
MGGDIVVESKLGKGCNFILAFPSMASETSPDIYKIPPEFADLYHVAREWTIFMVAEDELNKRALGAAIRNLGFTVKESATAKDAIQAASSEPPRTRLVVISGNNPFINDIIVDQHVFVYQTENTKIPALIITDDLSVYESKIPRKDRSVFRALKTPVYLSTLSQCLADMVILRKQKPRPGKACTTLLVSEDRFQNAILKQRLKYPLMEVVEKYSAEEALEYYKDQYYNIRVVIYDVDSIMGVEWIARIREFELVNLIPYSMIIMVGSEEINIKQGRYIGLNIEYYMKKPINIKELNAKIVDMYFDK